MPRTEEIAEAGRGGRKYVDEDQTIFEALSRDHRTVASILQQMEAEGVQDLEQARGLFDVLKNEVLSHSYAEDEVVYERLVEAEDEQLTDLIEEARQEHSAIEELLAEMEDMSPAADEWMEKLRALREMIEHHVEEEEGEVFERAGELIHGDEQRALAHDFHAAKEQIAFETSPQLDEGDVEEEQAEASSSRGEIYEPDDVSGVQTSGTGPGNYGTDRDVEQEPDRLDEGGGRSGGARNNTPIE